MEVSKSRFVDRRVSFRDSIYPTRRWKLGTHRAETRNRVERMAGNRFQIVTSLVVTEFNVCGVDVAILLQLQLGVERGVDLATPRQRNSPDLSAINYADSSRAKTEKSK